MPSRADDRAPVPLVVATVLRPQGGTGVQTHVGELARELASRDLPCPVVTPFSAGGPARDAVFAARRAVDPVSGPASVAWYRHWHRVFLERALRQALARPGAEGAALYCQCPVAAAAALRARRPDQRVVLAVHFWVSQADEWAGKGRIASGGPAYRGIRALERDVLRRVDGIVFVSAAAREALWLQDLGGVPAVTVPNFLATPTGGPPPAAPAAAADLLSVGSLEPRKNHRYLLDVLAEAARAGHRVTLDLAGDGPERRALRRQARRLGLDGQVRLLGYVPGAARLLPRYRAYVHAARGEPFGLAVLEAMAAGVPPVAGAVGGIPGIYRDGTEGRFWDLDDPAQGARVLVALLADEAARARMGAAARRRFRDRFAAGVVVPRLYRFLVAPAEPPAVAVPGPG